MKAAASSREIHQSQVTARNAGLRYVSDESPGIVRLRRGSTFSYRLPGGKAVRSGPVQQRIRRLAIPPAWTEVWICPVSNGHIQATGRDARGRKQYRYHPDWRQVRDGAKFDRILEFGRALKAIRRQVAFDLRRKDMPREKVLALVVRLLEKTHIRVGNDEYANANGSFGLTTMRNRHAKVAGGKVTFGFRGKGGKEHRIELRDAAMARLIRRCQQLPGEELFSYVDKDGVARDVTSGDINGYLRGIAGENFSAKDFRTWAGTVLAAIALRESETLDAPTKPRKQHLNRAVEAVAQILGNTPTICRKSYIHPGVLDHFVSGVTIPAKGNKRRRSDGLLADEVAVMTLLRNGNACSALPPRSQ